MAVDPFGMDRLHVDEPHLSQGVLFRVTKAWVDREQPFRTREADQKAVQSVSVVAAMDLQSFQVYNRVDHKLATTRI